jgi:acetylornithine/succinyldiaminopimelate/putrescine aminotransferase
VARHSQRRAGSCAHVCHSGDPVWRRGEHTLVRRACSAALLKPGMHGSTFGGNPICAAAALAVLRTLNDDGLIRQAEMLGASLRQGILSLNHRGVDHVRGRGLLCGIALTRPVAKAA